MPEFSNQKSIPPGLIQQCENCCRRVHVWDSDPYYRRLYSGPGWLKKGGILVSTVAPPSAEQAAKHGVRSGLISAHPSASQLSEIAKLVDAGKLKPVVETVLPLSEARHAHELNETGHARGKIGLKVA